jgi:hypothetical protein
MPRLVAEETYHSSGPIEAASVRPSWLYTEFILRASSLPQNSVDLAELGGFFFVDFSNVL